MLDIFKNYFVLCYKESEKSASDSETDSGSDDDKKRKQKKKKKEKESKRKSGKKYDSMMLTNLKLNIMNVF